MENDNKFSENGTQPKENRNERLPQFLENGRQPQTKNSQKINKKCKHNCCGTAPGNLVYDHLCNLLKLIKTTSNSFIKMI
jgi:hypothetical protein